MNILIADDSTSMRMVIKDNLKMMGFDNIIEAKDGQEAINILRGNMVDLILCDWSMPNRTGIDVLKKVRGDNKLGDTPFIMITVETKKENIMFALEMGVTDYIMKPFDTNTFSEKIKKVLHLN